jgi:hypothetical protein
MDDVVDKFGFKTTQVGHGSLDFGPQLHAQ